VDTRTRNITLFFALYNDAGALVSTVKVEEYTQGARPDRAEVTVYHQNGPKRLLLFDGVEGTVTETQEFNFRPHGPSLFSPGLRSALVYYQVTTEDAAGSTRVELNRDLSGLLASEAITFRRSAPETVDRALVEIGLLVNQIEDKRR
jgi:hypothetical protein